VISTKTIPTIQMLNFLAFWWAQKAAAPSCQKPICKEKLNNLSNRFRIQFQCKFFLVPYDAFQPRATLCDANWIEILQQQKNSTCILNHLIETMMYFEKMSCFFFKINE
jgi:hypothetical protein